LLVSLNALIGILLSLRFVVLPPLQLLPADEATKFMGKLMIRARTALLAVGAICAVSSLSEVIAQDGSIARLLLIALFLTIIALFGIPPDWAWYPRLLPRRRLLLDAGLAVGIVIIISWIAVELLRHY
jgi:hypothetical protein